MIEREHMPVTDAVAEMQRYRQDPWRLQSYLAAMGCFEELPHNGRLAYDNYEVCPPPDDLR